MKEHPFLLVLYSQTIVGNLINRGNNDIVFIYAEDWINNEYSFPLSSTIPLIEGEFTKEKILPFLKGLLTEDKQILETLGKTNQINFKNPFKVLNIAGEECAGAFSFIEPDDANNWKKLEKEKIEYTDIDVANLIKYGYTNVTEFTRTQGKLSLAGAQRKFALLKEKDKWYKPSGDLATTHIIKPNYIGYPGFVENEFFCMTLAKKIGIPVADVSIEQFATHKVLCVKRYDRFEDANQIIKLHQEDLCQAFSINPDDKYQNQNNISINKIISFLDEISQFKKADIITFIKTIIFNIIICGTDAHLKNYSLLILPGSRIQLAPLYDLISMYPYFEEINSRKEKITLSMKVNNSYKWNKIGYIDIIEEFSTTEIKKFKISVEDIFIGICREIINKIEDVLTMTINEGKIQSGSIEHKTMLTIKGNIIETISKYLYSVTPQKNN